MPNRPLAGVFAAQAAIELVVVSIACSHSGKLYFEGESWRRISAPSISDSPAPGCSRRLGSGCPAQRGEGGMRAQPAGGHERSGAA